MSSLFQGAAAAVENVRNRSDPSRTCRRCGNTRFERMPRVTFASMKIMPFFNLYPWRCTICGQTIARTLRANSEDRGNWD